MQAVDVAVIAAAGQGTRLGAQAPKALVRVDGETLIRRQLALLADVPDVRVIVGYQEDEVIRHVSEVRPDAIFVRNPRYAETQTIDSLRLALTPGVDRFLAIDGDLIIEPSSFARFQTRAAASDDALLALVEAGTEDGVMARVQSTRSLEVVAFDRGVVGHLEWSGLALLRPHHLRHDTRFVFESLVHHLPLPAMVVDAVEIDTPADLARAQRIVRTWRAEAPIAGPANLLAA